MINYCKSVILMLGIVSKLMVSINISPEKMSLMDLQYHFHWSDYSDLTRPDPKR